MDLTIADLTITNASPDQPDPPNQDLHRVSDKVKGCTHTDYHPREILVETRARDDHHPIRSIRAVPVTYLRKPFIAKPDCKLYHPGTLSSFLPSIH